MSCFDLNLEVTSSAIQIFGGNCLSREHPVEKLSRDACTSMICDGSNDSLAIAECNTVARCYPRTA